MGSSSGSFKRLLTNSLTMKGILASPSSGTALNLTYHSLPQGEERVSTVLSGTVYKWVHIEGMLFHRLDRRWRVKCKAETPRASDVAQSRKKNLLFVALQHDTDQMSAELKTLNIEGGGLLGVSVLRNIDHNFAYGGEVIYKLPFFLSAAVGIKYRSRDTQGLRNTFHADINVISQQIGASFMRELTEYTKVASCLEINPNNYHSDFGIGLEQVVDKRLTLHLAAQFSQGILLGASFSIPNFEVKMHLASLVSNKSMWSPKFGVQVQIVT